MKNLHILFSLLLIGTGWGLSGSESYSGLMDKAEKLTQRRYDPKSRAFKIKSRELDEILDSKEPRDKKIQRLKEYILELEEAGTGDPAQRMKANDPLKKVKEAAKKGNRDALFQLGMSYWEGQHQPRSFARALQCFSKAAAAGHQKSEFMLALAVWQGKGTIPDPAKAFNRFGKLYRKGFRAAGIPLGILCYEGNGTAKDHAAAVKYLLDGSSDRKNLPVVFYPEAVLGRIYYSGGYGVKADPGKAAEYLKAADDPESLFLLGRLYCAGKGLAKNEAAAVERFKAAAEKGHLLAGLELGRMYHLGQGVRKDDRLAVRYITPAADHDSPQGTASLILAEIYADPQSPVRDDRNAFHYYRQAARKGNPEACYRCGYMLVNGIGSDKDAAGAWEYLKAAANANHALAACLCGELQYNAKHVKESIPYFRKAADLDHAPAIRKFAGMALNGQGMEADPELAIRYLKKLGGRADVSDLELLADRKSTRLNSSHGY